VPYDVREQYCFFGVSWFDIDRFCARDPVDQRGVCTSADIVERKLTLKFGHRKQRGKHRRRAALLAEAFCLRQHLSTNPVEASEYRRNNRRRAVGLVWYPQFKEIGLLGKCADIRPRIITHGQGFCLAPAYDSRPEQACQTMSCQIVIGDHKYRAGIDARFELRLWVRLIPRRRPFSNLDFLRW